MQYLLALVVSIWSLSALADERLVGTWTWSGYQCRDYKTKRSATWAEVSAFYTNEIPIVIAIGQNFFAKLVGVKEVTFKYNSNTGVAVSEEIGSYEVREHSNEVQVRLYDRHEDFIGAFFLVEGQLVSHSVHGVCSGDNERVVTVYDRVINKPFLEFFRG